MIKFTRDELRMISEKLAAATDFTEDERNKLGNLRWKIRRLLEEYEQPITLQPLSTESPFDLTPRQWDVMRMVAEGKTMKQIGRALDISVRTVEFHKNAVMKRLNLRKTVELVRYAVTLNGKNGDV